MQRWTIVRLSDGVVLAASYTTPSEGSHPKDNGWDWNAATMKATRIAATPDQATQRWNGSGWVDDIPVLRARRWDEVKARRATAESVGCETPLGRVDSDPESQRKVSGAVQMAMIAQAAGQPFTIGWTMQSNETVDHDGMAIITMGVLVGQHVAACHAVALSKRSEIDDTDSAEAIAAINIEEGWPDAA